MTSAQENKPSSSAGDAGLEIDLWLIKSSGRIIGPFSTAELRRRIVAGDVAVIDDVQAPLGFWKPLRDRPEFFEAVVKARAEQSTIREDTEIAVVRSTSGIYAADTVLLKDMETSEERSTFLANAPSVGDLAGSVRKAAASRVLWIGVVAVLGLAAGLRWIRGTDGPRGGYSRGICPAAPVAFADAFSGQKWSEAERQLKSSTSKVGDRSEEQKVFAALLDLLHNGDRLQAKRVLEGIVSEPCTPQGESLALLALGISRLAMDEAFEAEDILSQANDGTLIGLAGAATFHRALAMLGQGKADSALALVTTIYESPLVGVPSRLLAAHIHWDRRQFAEALDALGKSADLPGPWRYEAQLFKALLAGETAGPDAAMRAALELFGQDPVEYQSYGSSPWVLAEFLRNQGPVRWATRLRDFLTPTLGLAFETIVLARSGGATRAEGALQDALRRYPNDGLLFAAKAYLSVELGRRDEAMSDIRLTLRLAGLPSASRQLVTLLRARLCEADGDRKCAISAWSERLKAPQPPLAAWIARDRLKLSGFPAGPLPDLRSQFPEIGDIAP